MISIFINGVDRTQYVKKNTISIESVLTKEVDRCNFTIINYGSKVYVPENEQEIIVYDDSDKIFAGIITRIEEVMDSFKILEYHIECSDYTRLADRRLVAEAYTSQTVEDIIQDIVGDYLTGFTYANVVCDITVDYIAFNYEPFSKCLQRLAELVGYDWYIDYDKDIHFFAKESNVAPFNLEDDNDTYVLNTLKIKRDSSQLRNVVYVRGAEYLADPITISLIADGEALTYPTSYKFTGISVTVDGVPQTVGIDNITDPTTVDVLYNFNEKILRFKTATKPAATKVIAISGTPYVPLIVEARDQPSIDQYGKFEFRIIDSSIKTKVAARDRGKADILSYGDTLNEGGFTTRKKGLRVGNYINIQSTVRGLDEDFVINRIAIKERNLEEFWYEVSIVTTKTYGVIEFLQKLLMADDRKIVIQEDEVVDRLWSASDSIPSFLETTITFDYESGPWYVSPGTPTGFVGFCEPS